VPKRMKLGRLDQSTVTGLLSSRLPQPCLPISRLSSASFSLAA
jgi:hypothetical protein